MKIFRSFSSEETKKFGEALAKEILKRETRNVRRKHAVILALSGELGAGKTTFVQGFFKGLGSKRRSPSPTFIIMRRTPLRGKKLKNAFHVDAYRIKKAAELEPLGFKEMFADPRNIILIEWAENIKKILPKDTIWLTFRHGANEEERTLHLPVLL